jgi:hypothetical protein
MASSACRSIAMIVAVVRKGTQHMMILIEAAKRANGERLPGRFRATLDDGTCLVESSTVPFCASARKLVELGYDPALPLMMRHRGSQHDALVSTIGTAAGLTVDESTTSFHKWRPPPQWNAENPGRKSPPVSETDEAATPLA